MKNADCFSQLMGILFLGVLISGCDKGHDDLKPVTNLDSGLVYYFPFDGNSIDQVSQETYDVKGATFDADRFNNPDGALRIADTTLYEQGVNVGSGLGEKEGSLSFWINLYELNKLHPLFLKGYFHNFSARTNNLFVTTDSALTVYWADTEGDVTVKTQKVIKPNKWQHILLRWAKSRSLLEVFVNGKKVLSNDYQSDLILDPSEPPENMCYSYNYEGSHTGSPNHFRGRIDEVRRYSRWLNDAEVDELSD
ncbi:LamG-like jellyroll fold domain-containing protein [Olivibacter domesticus]|uniref:Concanavalin A-like lectin/glucanases superfamily protein n=1 Tax=Olivibacter domesticus TaxID=407022 RepID=A0A1H7SCM1_OLID1|nr:LamG-like jellyroll fold domain-containing protein [Olivibacter domesticus]SEL69277.1 Concanavalin A-like lectin/glucanases superfamily protein [Olivibacter domesticus]